MEHVITRREQIGFSARSSLHSLCTSSSVPPALLESPFTLTTLMTLDTPIYPLSAAASPRAHKRPRPRPSPCASTMPASSPASYAAVSSGHPVFVPRRSPSVGLKLRRQDSDVAAPNSVNVGIQVGNGGLDMHDLYVQEDDLSTPELLEPPSLPAAAKIDWEIPRKALHSSIGMLVVCSTALLAYLLGQVSSFCHSISPVRKLSLSLLHSPVGLLSCQSLTRFGSTVRRLPGCTKLSLARSCEKAKRYAQLGHREVRRHADRMFTFLLQKKINGVIWYLVGVIFVLQFYPRDIAVVSILM